MDTASNETSALLGKQELLSSPDADKTSRGGAWKMAAKMAIVAAIAIVVTKWWDAQNISPASSDSEVLTSSENQPPTALQYRPFCMTYKSQTTARILQTSMGSPSQQWSRIPCYAQPENVRMWTKNSVTPDVHLNSYGSPDAILQVNFSQPAFSPKRQILGFGAAFTEAASLNYQTLSEKGKHKLMELFFGKSGLGYSIGRVHINSCDFSVKSYSFDDVDGDFELEHFDMDVSHDSQPDGMIDMVKRASSVLRTNWWTPAQEDDNVTAPDGLLKMYASPWSPPAWMKNPLESDADEAEHAENMTGSTQPSCLREGTGKASKYAKAWALYFSKFISAYRQQGVPFWAVTVQNEPEFPAPWEACAYTPKTQADFVAYHLGPQLKKDHPDVDILMFDHNKDHVITWAKTLLNQSHPSSKFIKGTAYHWYAGGMDRLLDGAVGSPNLHRFQSALENLMNSTEEQDSHIILGSEACHCPYTGYAGGDIEIYWARAERYAHTILADLAAGSNGWVEWNLILDSVGGPNHLNNLCDTTVLAVPHRAIVNGTEADIPPTFPFEKTKNPFGVNVGDTRTRAELNALGFPAIHLDDGLAVQPIYYYMGHISRYVRPGSRALSGLVEESRENFRAFRSSGQVVAGGGFNDLARNGIEVTAWPCEGSTRQVFFLNEANQIEVLGHDWKGKPTKSCIAKEVDTSFKGVTLTDCKRKTAATFNQVNVNEGEYQGMVQFVQTNVPSRSNMSNRCLVLSTLGNKGGALGPRGGAQVKYGSCASPKAFWNYEGSSSGEITSAHLSEGEVCMTTGWPFLQMGAFATPNGESENTVVLLNEARDSANYVLYNGAEAVLSGSIPPRSIQTILLDSN